MNHQIIYRHRLEYDTKVVGVILPVIITRGEQAEAVNAAIDTGSTLCVFSVKSPKDWGLEE